MQCRGGVPYGCRVRAYEGESWEAVACLAAGFSAYNGSGKPLSSLSAHFKIASEWPPCTNWSGPSGTYAKPVLWGGSFQVLQKPYGMEPGEEVSDTIFLLAFHEHQPEFESWDVDFRFGEAASSAGRDTGDLSRAARESRSPTGSAVPKPRDGSPAPFRAEPKCAGQPKGAACWMALADQPECYVWNADLQPDATVTWTADCSGGLAQGTGTLSWVWDSGQKTSESTGLLQDSKRHGRWVVRLANGTVECREPNYSGGRAGFFLELR